MTGERSLVSLRMATRLLAGSKPRRSASLALGRHSGVGRRGVWGAQRSALC